MKPIQQVIEVRVPVHTAYEQLSRFESYPQFMTGVQEVRKVSETTTHWIMDLDGKRTEFDAQITDCTLDERVAWKATGSTAFAEAITLKPVSADRTQVIAELEADAKALLPSDAHAQESLSRRLKADLDGFKRFVEQQSGSSPSMNKPSPALLGKNAKTREGSADLLRGSGQRSGNLAPDASLASGGMLDDESDAKSRRRGGGGRA